MARTSRPKSPRQLGASSVDSALLRVVCESDPNLAPILQEPLVCKVAETNRKVWLKENAGAIAAYNAFVDEHGVFSAEDRSF